MCEWEASRLIDKPLDRRGDEGGRERREREGAEENERVSERK